MEVASTYDHDSSRVPPFSSCYAVVESTSSAFKSPENEVVQQLPVKCEEFDSSDYSAAMKVQKFYRGYRTRRLLADSAVVAEELWYHLPTSSVPNYFTFFTLFESNENDHFFQ